MAGEESKGGFPWVLVIAVLIIAAGIYYYIAYMQPAAPEEPEDLYGPQLEALNSEIGRAETQGAADAARAKVDGIKGKLTGSYAKYLPLAEAQLAVLDVIDLNLEYYSEADSYARNGVDCSKDYASLISDMQGAEAKKNAARSKVNGYLYDNPNSTATLLVTKLDAIDAGGMGVFAEMIERDYSENCVPTGEAIGYATPLTKEEALRLVVNEVVKGQDYYVYMIDAPLVSGDVVTIKRPEGNYDIDVTENTWFFFLDSEPFAPFAHPTKFVFVSQATADYKVYDAQFSPVINGITYWSTLEERLDPNQIVYPENASIEEAELLGSTYEYRFTYDSLGAPGSGVPAGTPVPFDDKLCCEGVDKKKYGLVMQGYDEQMFKSDTVNAYNMLKLRGYSNADITYLTAKEGDALSDGQTSITSVAEALNNIITNAKCCDEVFIYFSTHGASVQHWQYKHKTTGETKWIKNLGELTGGAANWEYTGSTGKYHVMDINPQFTTPATEPGGAPVTHGSADGGDGWSYEIASFLDDMDSCYITVMYFSCYSGMAAPTLAGKGRTIITPTGDTTAWGRSTPGFGSYFTNWFIEAKMAGKSDREAFDYAKAKTTADATAKGRAQEGVYTPSTERCRCCHVICPENKICTAVEGDGTDSPLCPKIGDYCGTVEGPVTAITHTECSHYECIVVEGEGEDQCMYDSDCEPEEAVCGDGVITGMEECDYGSPSTNKCPEGKYCKDDCMCHDLETSVVCGDGKISRPNEDCDGGNVLFKICPEGYECKICKCEPIEVFCGDGKINPPEECDHGNTATKECPTAGEVCQNCQCIPREEATHRECVDEACVSVQGYGEDQCWSDSQCETPRHSECQNQQCVEVEGEGRDECITDSDCEVPAECGDGDVEGWEECEYDDDCSEGQICIECFCLDIPAYCGNGVLDAGEQCEKNSDCSEGQACGGNCKCVNPPSLNCDYICGQMGLPIILGHGYPTADACGAAAAEEATTCYTTCIKYGFERVDNIAGWDSCCCKKKEMFPCSDCPGTNPVCPPCPSEYQ